MMLKPSAQTADDQKESEVTTSVEYEPPDYFEAHQRIKRAENDQSDKLDLSRLKLIEVPIELLELTQLKRLHLCRNRLLEIPEELCLKLCNLRWLDLRSNLLTRLPSSIRQMRDLQILLLDDNRIRILPFELGLLRKLKGIYVRNNPLQFPTKKVMDKGPKGILKYLYECYISREDSASPRGSRLYRRIMEDQKAAFFEKNNSAEAVLASPGREKENIQEGLANQKVQLAELCEQLNRNGIISNTDEGLGSEATISSSEPSSAQREKSSDSLVTDDSKETVQPGSAESVKTCEPTRDLYDPELEEILQFSALKETENELEKEKPLRTGSAPTPTTRTVLPWVTSSSHMYKRIKKQYLMRRRNPPKPSRGSVFETLSSQSSRHEALLPENPPQPTLDQIRAQHMKERKQKMRQQAMMRQQATLQKLLDAERIRGWRQAYTKQQKAKLLEYLSKTQKDIREEADQRIVAAPFDIGQDDLKMLSTIELHALRNRRIRSASPPPNLSAQTVLQLELASFERDRRLTQRVQRHLDEVGGRFQIPLPNTREALYAEMLTAKRDLELALRLHHRVKQRMETMEHFRGSNRRDLW